MNEQMNEKRDYVVRRNPTFNISLIKRFDRDNDRYFPHIYYYFTLNKTVYRGTTKTSDIDEGERISIQKYIDVKEKRTVGKVVKFETIVKRFLKYIEKRVSPKTYIEYDRQSGLLVEKFKGKDIHTFKQGDYNDYQYWRESYYSSHKRKRIQRYERDGKKLKGCHFKEVGNSTINREIGLLVTILRYSQKQLGYLENMTIPSWTKLEERVRQETVSGREYFKLKRYWEEKNPYYWKIISWVDSTGTRYPSEVNKLVWGDVDRDSCNQDQDRDLKADLHLSWPILISELWQALERPF